MSHQADFHLALFENCSYRGAWGKLTAGLEGLPLLRPAASSLSRARRRVGAAPLRRLFEILAGPVAHLGQAGSFYRGLRTVTVDGTLLHMPDEEALTWRYLKRVGESVEFGYPLLRLVVLVECGTRAVLAAAFGPESDGELTYAERLLNVLDRTMLLLADVGFDGAEFALTGHRGRVTGCRVSRHPYRIRPVDQSRSFSVREGAAVMAETRSRWSAVRGMFTRSP